MSGTAFEWDLVTPPAQADGQASTATEELYGSDLWCEDDIDELASELPSTSPLLVAQANYRRLSTERGALIDDPDYGFDLLGLLHAEITPAFIASIPGQVENELRKDDRNETIECKISNITHRSFDVEIRGTTATGPFDLVIALDPDNVESTLKAMSA